MFYTLEEAAEVLKKPAAEVKAMADRNELNLFRDQDRLMFKKEQVDLIASAGKDGGSGFALADDLEPLSLTSSGSGSALGLAGQSGGPFDIKEQTGISIFDTEDTETADPAAQTQISDAPAIGSEFSSGDAASSGSGLLDLTREADDTSLGADLLDDVYGQDTMSATAADTGFTGDGGQLFESAEPAGMAAAAAITSAPVVATEAYDGAGSGLVGGLALGVALTTVLAMTVLLLAMTGAGSLVSSIGGNALMVAGVLAGLTLLLGGLGWFFGRKS